MNNTNSGTNIDYVTKLKQLVNKYPTEDSSFIQDSGHLVEETQLSEVKQDDLNLESSGSSTCVSKEYEQEWIKRVEEDPYSLQDCELQTQAICLAAITSDKYMHVFDKS